jgi:hypothetical protein
VNRFSSECDKTVRLCKDISVSAAAGSHSVNFFKVHGPVRVIDQVAEIISVTTLTNLTAVYADLWDGTVSDLLTDSSPGAVLSGAPVGTYFTKDKDSTNPYSVVLADQARVHEVVSDRFIGLPFTVNKKNGADTFIRLNFTTTDDPVVFDIHLRFEWQPINGGWLESLV